MPVAVASREVGAEVGFRCWCECFTARIEAPKP